MELRAEKLRDSVAHLATWNGWRRYGPAAGSVATHIAIGAAAVTLLAASNKPKPMGERALEVTLIAEAALNPPSMSALPPEAPTPPKSQPKEEAIPDTQAAPRRQARKPASRQTGAPETIPEAGSNDEDSVYIGPMANAPPGVPLGLRSLLETDPCHPQDGIPRGDCRTDWAALMERGDLSITPSYMRLRELYPGYQAPERQTRRTSGVFRPGGPMPGGPAGIGGINDLTGRVPRRPDNGFGD
jgi:hypothetical protein